MQRAHIKPWFKASLQLIGWGWLFIIAETVFFLIRDGWHYYAETHAERVCDMIGSSMTGAGMLGGIACWILLLLTPNQR